LNEKLLEIYSRKRVLLYFFFVDPNLKQHLKLKKKKVEHENFFFFYKD